VGGGGKGEGSGGLQLAVQVCSWAVCGPCPAALLSQSAQRQPAARQCLLLLLRGTASGLPEPCVEPLY